MQRVPFTSLSLDTAHDQLAVLGQDSDLAGGLVEVDADVVLN
jgi:hypothetical protein